jgi:hypothetical protein
MLSRLIHQNGPGHNPGLEKRICISTVEVPSSRINPSAAEDGDTEYWWPKEPRAYKSRSNKDMDVLI